MASISIEEENYVRMSLLLTGISPRAVRKFFNGEFDPACLEVSLKKDYNKLLALQRKNRINKSQWKLLFPRFPDVPDSKKFDITLMLTLLRNLTDITNDDDVGFDFIPTAIETTPRADLARIKNYRNNLAHLDEGKVESSYLNIAWNDLTGAIGRLGGQHMKEECDLLRTKTLDQTNKEILMDIKRSYDEIKELKESLDSLKRSHEVLEEAHTKIQRSHTDLQVDHAEMNKKVHRLKIVQDDTVPWNTRERIKDTLKSWKENDDKMFINTRASKHVLKSIQENSCVTITASSGVGKTTTLRHVALQMANEKYDVLVVTDPADIVKFYNPKKKTLFVIDDLCGNFSVNQSDIKRWEPVIVDIKLILEKGQAKLIAACRLQVYQDEKFESLSVFKSRACNLLSEKICLSKTEKQSIAELYLKSNASAITDYYHLFDCFPLLCKMYHDSPHLNITNFFQNPFSVYGDEIDNLRKKGHHTKYCALALCVIFNNKLKEEMLTEEVNEETRVIIENTCEACRLDRGTSRLVLLDELDSFKDTFIKKEENVYMSIHDKIFDFLSFFYGQKIIHCLIKNADSGLIKERFSFESIVDIDQFITIVPKKYHQTYIQRMIVDWSNGKVQDVFSNFNMKIPEFRQQLVLHLCGNFSVNQSDIKRWEPVIVDIKLILEKGQAKLIAACRLQVYQDEKFESLSVFKSRACNLLSEKICLSKTEKQSIAELYLKSNASAITDYYHLFDCFPLLCKMYHDSPHLNITNFFQNPFSVYGDEIDNLRKKGHHTKYCALALCVIFNNKLKEEMLTEEVNEETRVIIENTCEACRLDRGTSRLVLLDELDSFKDTFIKKEENVYMSIHDKIFDFLSFFYGQKIIHCLIKNADSGLIKERFSFESIVDIDQFITIVPKKYHQTYIQRMIVDWSNGKVQDVFSNFNMKIPEFRQQLVLHLNTLDISHQRQLAHMCNKSNPMEIFLNAKMNNDDHHYVNDGYYDSVLLRCCAIRDIRLVRWCFNLGVDVNKCAYRVLLPSKPLIKTSPLMKACEQGNTEIVNTLLDREADYNECAMFDYSSFIFACEHGRTEVVMMLLGREAYCKNCIANGRSPVRTACENGHKELVQILLDRGGNCDDDGQTPRMIACQHGHTEIVKKLLDRVLGCHKDDSSGQLPLIEACKHGHTEIVKILLDMGADYNECNEFGKSPLMKACKFGHTEVVKMLLDRGTDYNKCDLNEKTPLLKACKYGHTEIVKILLDKGTDCNELDINLHSPVWEACCNGHKEIVQMLFDKGAEYDKCDVCGQSPVWTASEHGHTEIVRMLLDKGVDWNKGNFRDISPFMIACENGHTELVNILLDRGVDCNKCDLSHVSPVIMACKHGHTEIVKILLERGVYFNKCDMWGQSPVMKACEHGHTEIVKMLLDKGADYNQCDTFGGYPVMFACEHGHTETVKMLLERGANYNKCNRDENTPFSMAYKHGHKEIVNMLLDRKAICNSTDE